MGRLKKIFLKTVKRAVGHLNKRESSCDFCHKTPEVWLNWFGWMIILLPQGKTVRLKGLCEPVSRAWRHEKKCVNNQCGKKYLSEYWNNISFCQLQLVLSFGFVVEQDLATLGHYGDIAYRISCMEAEPFGFMLDRIKNISTIMTNLIKLVYSFTLFTLGINLGRLWWTEDKSCKPSTRRDLCLQWVIEQLYELWLTYSWNLNYFLSQVNCIRGCK